MRRLSVRMALFLPAVCILWGGARDAAGQGATEEAAKNTRLNALYRAYQGYEVTNGEPAKKIEDLSLGKEDVKELKRWFNVAELGASLADAKKQDLAKMVMAYDKEAPKAGGLVMFYDGTIKPL